MRHTAEISNIVYDLGGVLLTYDPLRYIHSFVQNQEDRDWCVQNILRGPEWVELDRGNLTLAEARQIFIERDPGKGETIQRLFDCWAGIFKPIHFTIQSIDIFKRKGYRVFLLSNFIREYFSAIRLKHMFFQDFDGMVISYQIGYAKPEREIYCHLLKKYALIPSTCLFIDDRVDNVEAAIDEGLNAVQYRGQAELNKAFHKYGLL